MCRQMLVTLLCCLPCLPAGAQEQAERTFRRWDRNADGVLTRDEVPAGARRWFSGKDRNQDGRITLEEHLAGARRKREPSDSKQAPRGSEATITKLTIRQTWPQQPEGYDREAFVSVPQKAQDKYPVVIFFHGNGGQASRSINQLRYLNSNILVVPQGYQRSWNVSGERSQAPDVKYVSQLIARIGQKYPEADLDRLTLIGSSNGAAMIHRLLIEVDKKPFRQAILLSASLVVEQQHQGSFWMPSRTTQDYDTRKKPGGGAAILYFHGTEDRVVPYKGGLRSGKHEHLSAQKTTYLWARALGHDGPQIADHAGQQVEQGIYRNSYPKAKVVHYKLVGAKHGTAPYSQQVRAWIQQAVSR